MGTRPRSHILLAPLRASNYRTLVRSVRVFPDTLEMLRRYVVNRGDYPYDIPIRTPQGTIRPTLYSLHDVRTANEIFCREDYRGAGDARVIVDVGANIGISALYFLTRNAESRVHCYEPSPVNLDRLRHNLAGFEQRARISPVAVAEAAGTLDFNAEPTGRYGGIVREGYTAEVVNVIQVQVVDVNSVLEFVLEREQRIDVLKIDTEGSELSTIEAVRPDLQRRIGTVYLEAEPGLPIHPEVFDQEQMGTVCRLTARAA